MEQEHIEREKILVNRYIQLIEYAKPNVKPEKNKEGSLELSHILWMLYKMKDSNFVSLTTESAWISWVQSSLYLHKLIIIRHEIDITRDILKR